MQRGTFQMMKSVNRSIILNKIRNHAPISRAQIAKQTKLTPPTVSSIVRELLEQKLVIESDIGESKGGRKPTMLTVNNNGFFVIGVDAGPSSIECVLSNLAGEIINRHVQTLDFPLTNDAFLMIMVNGVESIIQKIEDEDKILGIGVAMHGIVDTEHGSSLFAPILHLKDIPIKKVLEEKFNLVVHVENDARAMALGETWFGNYGPLPSMMAVNLGSGVGAGLVIDEKIYNGFSGLASEIGHMTVDMNGELCECGNKGCLQAYVSAPSIVKRAQKIVPDKNISSSKQLYEQALAGDEDCKQLLENTGTIIGIGLTNVVHIVNPAVIILGGGVAKSEKFLVPAVKQVIQKQGLTDSAKETKIVSSALGDDATVLGAVALLLQDLFQPQ